MGLDMYLSKRIYVGAVYEHRNVKLEVKGTISGTPIKVNPKKIEYISERVMYWRKANQIHNWFVQNCQDGEDDCRDAYVSKEQLQELVDACKQALEQRDKAKDLLPTTKGFFFGSTDYDDYYFDDLKETVNVLEEELKNEDEEGDYYYTSSW